jgi:hypothetical protein
VCRELRKTYTEQKINDENDLKNVSGGKEKRKDEGMKERN